MLTPKCKLYPPCCCNKHSWYLTGWWSHLFISARLFACVFWTLSKPWTASTFCTICSSALQIPWPSFLQLCLPAEESNIPKRICVVSLSRPWRWVGGQLMPVRGPWHTTGWWTASTSSGWATDQHTFIEFIWNTQRSSAQGSPEYTPQWSVNV